MASAITELPPEGKISMIGIWVETLLYGVNLVAYGLCMRSLFRRGKAPRLVLKVTCTVIFVLCTVHVAASLRQLLEAFVYPTSDLPGYSTTYWLQYSTPLRWLKDIIFNTLVLAQDFILIWRLYVVFMDDWRVVVVPIIFATGSVGCVYTASSVPFGTVTGPLVIASWVSGLLLNMLVSGGIVARLWWMGRRIAALTASTAANRFTSSMYVVIESGAMTVVYDTTVLALFVSRSPAAFSSLDVVVQLIVLNPLLIILQAGRTSPYHIQSGDLERKAPSTLDEMRFRVGVLREQDEDTVSTHVGRSFD